MSKNTKPQVSIGIPAFNEALNIKKLLELLVSQEQTQIEICEIIVFTDCSTDGTPEIAESVKSNLIRVVRGTKRVGQQVLQNNMLNSFIGDCLVIIEADMLPASTLTIQNLVLPLFNKQTNKPDMVVGKPLAIQPTTFFEKIMVHTATIKSKIFSKWNDGDNLFSCGGHSAKAISKHFAKKLMYPTHVPEDAYTYLRLKELGLKLLVTSNAQFYMRHVTHLQDRIKQCSKFQSGKEALKKEFSSEFVRKEYEIPRKISSQVTLQFLLKNPILTMLSLLELCLNRVLTRNKKTFTAQHDTYASSKDLSSMTKKSVKKMASRSWTASISKSISFITFALLLIILLATVHGKPGTPTSNELNSDHWKENGPLELSPDRGRYALTYSLLEDKSFSFSIPVAQFAAPDVAQKDGKFVSLFAPGLSYLIMPGYLLGKQLGYGQLGSFLVITIFAFINALLVFSITRKLGVSRGAATVATLLALTASPAFAYSATLYQHHISTFLVLICIWLLQKYEGWKPLIFVWFFCAVSIVIDNPNVFLMTPIGIYALSRIISIKKESLTYLISLRFFRIFTFLGVVLPIAFFLYFNKMSYGNPMQLAGTVASAEVVTNEGHADISDIAKKELESKQEEYQPKKKKTALGFFKTRRLVQGFFTHFISKDRGIITYTPIVLIGFIGLFLLFKTNSEIAQVVGGVIGANVLLYSMWSDPYGGWAFGSRYLIPTYILLCICIGFLLEKWRKNIVILLVILLLGSYSIVVNTIGATTSNRIPPQIEVLSIEALSGKQERYSFDRGYYDFLLQNKSKSFSFEVFLHTYITALFFAQVIAGTAIALLLINLAHTYFEKRITN